MRRLLVNDCLTCIPGTRTFWHDLQEWFMMEFVGGGYPDLAGIAMEHANPALACGERLGNDATLIIRNATWFPPIQTQVPTISLLQDIIAEGPQREMQEAVIKSSHAVIFNSAFTESKYHGFHAEVSRAIIPLPVDFTLFEPGNPMGLQQALSLPDGCVCWIGASQGAAGQVKGFDIFLRVVRTNPDIPFVAVFKDTLPEYSPPNLRMYCRLTHAELVKVIGACRVGLCTSRMESQHLAGIEMGACGLPLVVPPVGCYWQRKDWPGCEALEYTPAAFTQGIRSSMGKIGVMSGQVRDYWRAEFDKPVVKAAWTKLIEEVECSGAS